MSRGLSLLATLAGPLLAVLCVALLPAQSTIYVPDPNPLVPGGTAVNTIPFGSAAYTYMGRIPASSMDPANTEVHDVAFAPGTSGPWTSTSLLVGIGHLPNPLPCPSFTFPGPGGATPGSYLDFTVLYDSAVQSPLTWTWTAQSWSFLGLRALGGAPFVWNGVHDIGVYVTFQGATRTSGFHRNPNGSPERTYASGYQATTGSACGALFGIVIALDVEPGGPQVIPYGAGCASSSGLVPSLGTNEIPSIGNVAFLVEISMTNPGSPTYLFLALGAGLTPLGGGCDLLLDFPSLLNLINIGFSPFGPALANGIGVATFPAPLPFDPGLSGARLWLQGAVLDTTPLGFAVTNGLEIRIF